MRSLLLFLACCSAATPSAVATPSCDASGRAAITRDAQWIVLASGEHLHVLSPDGARVKEIETNLHMITDATFVADTHVLALSGWDDGGFMSSEIFSIPDGEHLASGGELVTRDDRTGVVVYFERTPNADVMHTWNARTRSAMPNGASPERWMDPEHERPASREDARARAIVDAACKR